VTALSWVGKAYRYDQRTYWRMPQAAFFSVLMPVMMLVIFGALNGGQLDDLQTTYKHYLLVGMTVFSVLGAAYGNLAARIIWRRETGIYQRLRTTPVPASALLAGQVAGAITVVLITLALLLSIAALFFDIAMPQNWPLFIVIVVLGTACFAALGAAVATFVTSLEAIDPVVWATLLPLTFISGIFQYIESDAFLARVAELFPLRHLLLANMDAFGLPHSGSTAGHLAIAAAWTFVGLLIAVRRFRWAPSR
jgi:ABC-2 type transport system permease protein